MSDSGRNHRLPLKLLALARRSVETASRRLAYLQASRREAAAALDKLEAAIRTEEAVALGRAEIGFREFAGYLAGAGAKRASLETTCRALDSEIDEALDALSAAEIERRKLEHLANLSAEAAKNRRDKRDGAILEEAGRRLVADRSSRF